MIKHPQDRYERRKLKQIHEKKKSKFKGREVLRDQETAHELQSYRSGELVTD